MLHLVNMTALRPLAGDYLDNRHPNEGESFRTDNLTAEELERHGLACRQYTPPPLPAVKITLPAFRMPPRIEPKAEAPPKPELALIEKMYTPPAIEAKMLHPPENKMLRIDANKVLPLSAPRPGMPAPVKPKRGRGRPKGARNKPKD